MRALGLLGAVLLGAAAAAWAGTLDSVEISVTNVPLTTNTAATAASAPINGTIRQLKIDVSASANMDLDLSTPDGVVVYSADDVQADAVIHPQTEGYTSGGATNGQFVAIPVIGVLTLTASDEATTNKNVTVTVLFER